MARRQFPPQKAALNAASRQLIGEEIEPLARLSRCAAKGNQNNNNEQKEQREEQTNAGQSGINCITGWNLSSPKVGAARVVLSTETLSWCRNILKDSFFRRNRMQIENEQVFIVVK